MQKVSEAFRDGQSHSLSLALVHGYGGPHPYPLNMAGVQIAIEFRSWEKVCPQFLQGERKHARHRIWEIISFSCRAPRLRDDESWPPPGQDAADSLPRGVRILAGIFGEKLDDAHLPIRTFGVHDRKRAASVDSETKPPAAADPGGGHSGHVPPPPPPPPLHL